MSHYISQTPEETFHLGQKFASTLKGGEVIAFRGEMGAGKTTFCRGIAAGLATTDPASSPTYSIVNYYRGPIPFAHFDAWRITSEEDLEAAGFYDYLENNAVVAVEWSEKVEDLLPPNTMYITVTQGPQGEREFLIEGANQF